MKGVGQPADLIGLVSDIIGLINEHELQNAVLRVREAERIHIRVIAEQSADQIAEINKTLSSIDQSCERLRSVVEGLPAAERIFAKAQIERVIEQHFNTERNELRKRKRALSKHH